MTKFHQKLLSIFINENGSKQHVRARYGNFAGWSSIIINSLLFLLKLITGLMINSLSLIADSIHSISDTATSIIVIVGFKIAGKPADKEHPFGHQRAEYVASLIIAIILIIAGVEFIKEGGSRIYSPSAIKYSLPVLLIIIFTMVIKFWMGHLTKYIGKKINSQSIQADAVHHYTDVISTFFVLISVYLSQFGLYYFDGIGSILVGLMLIYTGFSIALEAGHHILGVAPSTKLIKKVKELSNSIEGVLDTHDIVIHQYGDKKFICLHIEVDCQYSCGKSHEISKQVEEKIFHELNAYITTHIDPIELDNPILKKIHKKMSHLKNNKEFLKDYHDLRMNRDHELVILDVVFSNKKNKHKDYKQDILTELTATFKDINFDIHIDPIFVNN